MALEKTVQAMEKKANFFWNDLYYPTPDPKKSAREWQENLRPVRSMSDLNKAVPQPPLCQDSDDDDFPVWEVHRDWSDDDVFTATLENEDYQESPAITETFI